MTLLEHPRDGLEGAHEVGDLETRPRTARDNDQIRTEPCDGRRVAARAD